MVDELVGDQRHEVTEHDLYDRPIPSKGQSGAESHYSGLADWRGDHPLRKGTREPLRHLEGTTVGIQDVLADDEDIRPAFHQAVQRGIEGLDDTHQARIPSAADTVLSPFNASSRAQRTHCSAISISSAQRQVLAI